MSLRAVLNVVWHLFDDEAREEFDERLAYIADPDAVKARQRARRRAFTESFGEVVAG